MHFEDSHFTRIKSEFDCDYEVENLNLQLGLPPEGIVRFFFEKSTIVDFSKKNRTIAFAIGEAKQREVKAFIYELMHNEFELVDFPKILTRK